MGAVDVVVQVEAPPSVASGLQRVGRAGHQVGATSRGVFFPNHRGDLIESAVVVERMRRGAIEEVAELRNPLDVLAQQIVAVVAVEETKADELYALVRRATASPSCRTAPSRRCWTCSAAATPSRTSPSCALGWSGSATPACSPPARGRNGWPSPPAAPFPTAGCSASSWSARATPPGGTPRVVGSGSWTRRWSTRPGSATCSPSAPPAGGWSRSPMTRCWSRPPRAARAGCRSGRVTLPPGRLELGRAFGQFVREVGAHAAGARHDRLAEAGLDEFAARNLVSYLAEQQDGHRGVAHRPDHRGRAFPRRAGRLAGLRALRARHRPC